MGNTPYDDVFRTLLNDCPALIIPVVNEAFGESYSGTEEIRFFPNEHFLNRQEGQEQERVTDTCFEISGSGKQKYHLECQSTEDRSMLPRFFEYDTQIALDGGHFEEEAFRAVLPRSAVLYLRHRSTTPDGMSIWIETEKDVLLHRICVMKTQEYTASELFARGLLFLVPFHIFAHEKRFTRYETDGTALEELKAEYEMIRTELERLCETGKIDEYTKCMIIDMSNKVLGHIAAKYGTVRERVKAVMGGRVLEYEAKTIRREGISMGRTQAYLELVRDGLLSVEEAARRLEKNTQELEALLRLKAEL